jgi:hypothetical protein
MMYTIQKYWLLLLLLLAWSIVLCGLLPPADAATYYVDATEGSDSNNGTTTSTPFQTLAKLETLALVPGDTILFQRGETWSGQTLVLVNKSGNAYSPIRLGAYGSGAAPVLSGGRPLTGLSWGVHSGNIQSASIDTFLGTYGDFLTLFTDDRRATLARTPNVGTYFLVNSVVNQLTTITTVEGNMKESYVNDGKGIFNIYKGWEHGFFHFGFVESTNQLTITGTQDYLDFNDQATWSKRYFVENALEHIDNPGEWYADADTLYYYPRAGESLASIPIIAPVTTQVLRLDTCDYIEIADLDLAHTDWYVPTNGHSGQQSGRYIEQEGTLYLDECDHVTLRNLTVRHTGAHAIQTNHRFGSHLTIRDCTMTDVGAGGIWVGSGNWRTEIDNSYNTIVNNTIRGYGKQYREGTGIVVATSGFNVVAHNEVTDGAASGISIGWSWEDLENEARWNLVEYNHVWDVGKELVDIGGIYLLANAHGSVVRRNLIHDIYRTSHHAPAADFNGHFRGIYVDDSGYYYVIEDNLIYRTGDAINLHRACENVVTNNFLLNSYFNPIRLAGEWVLDTESKRLAQGNQIYRNLIFDNDGVSYNSQSWIYNVVGQPSGFADWNAIYPAWKVNAPNSGVAGTTLEAMQGAYPGWDAHSIINVDPQLNETAAGSLVLPASNTPVTGFTFPSTATTPEKKIGFRNFSLALAGPQDLSTDTIAPTRPRDATATIAGNTVILSWEASLDQVGVTGYHVYRDGDLIAGVPHVLPADPVTSTTHPFSYTDSVRPGTTYAYTLTALDRAGNESDPCDALILTTPAAVASERRRAEVTDGRTPSLYVDFTTDADGKFYFTSENRFSGRIVGFTLNPDDTFAPTADFDLVVEDRAGNDLLQGNGANLSGTTTTLVVEPLGRIADQPLRVEITNAGTYTRGVLQVYLQ